MSELQRLKNLLPPENESWVFVEAAAAIDPPLITLEEIGRDEVEIQIDLDEWDNFAIDHRNLLFWHEVGKIQNDAIPRDGWEMAALAIGLGGAIGELWVQDGLLLLLALGLSSFAGYRLYLKNNSEKKLQDAIFADERAIDLACRFGYSIPNAYKSLGGALKELIEKTRKKKKRSFFEDRLDALRKMKPFDTHLHYFDRHRLPDSVEKELNLTFHETVESMVKVCDVVTINCPLHPETENLFDDAMISKMKKGAYIVNTARGKICNRDAIAKALKSGQLSGYAGDVWFPQPAPNDHVWRSMPNHGMTPHTSGTSLTAQARYADGVREILECFFDGSEIRNQYLIVKDGQLAGMGAHSYSKGSATSGSEEAAKYKKA